MNHSSIRKTVLSSIAFIALSANANTERSLTCSKEEERPHDQYDLIALAKTIHIDVQPPDSITQGAEFTLDFSKSTVPSGKVIVEEKGINPGFKLVSSTSTTYTYKAPSSPGRSVAKFHVVDDCYKVASPIQFDLIVK